LCQSVDDAAAVTGTPVRPEFAAPDLAACLRRQACCRALGPRRNIRCCFVTGGSRGATAVNQLHQRPPALRAALPELQVLHLTGAGDSEKVRLACRMPWRWSGLS
jgi:UDP-N-acetylglucosamine:LPS N-acetylglucosamine transferase